MTRKILDRLDVAVDGSLSIITTLEFFEHHFAKLGHRESPYDPTLSAHRHTADTEHAKASAAKASFETGLEEINGDLLEADFRPGTTFGLPVIRPNRRRRSLRSP